MRARRNKKDGDNYQDRFPADLEKTTIEDGWKVTPKKKGSPKKTNPEKKTSEKLTPARTSSSSTHLPTRNSTQQTESSSASFSGGKKRKRVSRSKASESGPESKTAQVSEHDEPGEWVGGLTWVPHSSQNIRHTRSPSVEAVIVCARREVGLGLIKSQEENDLWRGKEASSMVHRECLGYECIASKLITS